MEILTRGIELMGLQVTEDAVRGLAQYFRELLKWNKKMNLVAKGEDLQIIESHFLDSLSLLPLIENSAQTQSLLDVGTGAGFPGLVVKTALAELDLTLMEPRLKRVSFLKHIMRTLRLRHVTILSERLDKDYGARQSHKLFPLITSRALTGIEEFLKIAAQACCLGGKVICMKGPGSESKIRLWEQKGGDSLFQLGEIVELRLPFSGAMRTLLVFTKKQHKA